MKRATPVDKTIVVEILTESFEQNKSVLSVVNNKVSSIPKLMAYSFEKGMDKGEVWINKDSTAALIMLRPKQARFSLKSLLLDLKLVFSIISLSRIFEILIREKIIKKKQPKAEFIHLWYLGVRKDYQSKGVGSKLLSKFLEIKQVEKVPIYLETSTLRNLSFYKRLGFKIVDQISKELPYTLYILAKNPI